MNVLILSDKIKQDTQFADLNIVPVATAEELLKKQPQIYPCLLLLDPALLDLHRLLALPESLRNTPAVFLLNKNKITSDYSDLFSLFQPFRCIEEVDLIADFSRLTVELAAQSKALLLRELSSVFYQALSEKRMQYPARSSCLGEIAANNLLHLQHLLEKFSLSAIYVVCICSSGLFTNSHYKQLQQFVAAHPVLLFAIPFENDFTILASTPDTDRFTQLLLDFQTISSMEYSIGISHRLPVSEQMNIPAAFQQAKLATELNFYQKAEIVPWTDSLFSQDLDLRMVISYEKELTNAILMGYHESELLYVLNEYVNYFRKNQILPSLVCDLVYRYLNSLDRVFKFIDPLCSIDLSQITLADVCAEGTLDKLHATLADMLTDFLRKGEHYAPSSDHLLLEIQSWIDNHLDQPISLATIEQEFLINKFVFCRQFKKFTGQTFNKYLKNVRMQNALTLLKNTDIKIYEIAHRLAFRDESYFSSAFKKEFGISPTEYRGQK